MFRLISFLELAILTSCFFKWHEAAPFNLFSFGLYFLFGLTEGNQYPSFYRPADKQVKAAHTAKKYKQKPTHCKIILDKNINTVLIEPKQKLFLDVTKSEKIIIF